MEPSNAAPLSAAHHASQFSSRRRTLALFIVAFAFVMDLLDSTIVNIAIPSIQTNLHASYTAIQWLIAGYLLSFATLLITGGRMGDVFGYKKLFLSGVGGFTVASLLSGLAWSPDILIGARVLQGAMAALMVPQVMSLMQVMYKKEERGSVMGLFGALGGLSATLGPIVGGLLIQANVAGLNWRPIFLINIPIGLFAFIAGSIVLPDGKSEHPLKLDVIGTFMVMIALLLLVFPLVEGRELGWPLWTYVSMLASIPAFYLFARYESHKFKLDGSPLIVPSLFKTSSFVRGLIINVVFESYFIGYFLIFTLMLQAGLGFSVIRAALTGIPFAVGIGLGIGAIGPKLMPILGRRLIQIGILMMGLGYVGTALIIHHYGLGTHPWQLILSILISGLGAGFSMGPIFGVVLTDVDVKHAGSASGVLNAFQQVGGAVGIAAIGVIFFGLISHGATKSIADVTPQIHTDLTAAHVPSAAQDEIVNGFSACFNDRVNQKDSTATPASCQNQAGSPAVGAALEKAGKQANERNFASSFNWSIGYEIILLLVTFCLSFLLPRKINPSAGEMA